MKSNTFLIGGNMSAKLSTLIDTRLLVQANSGGGKSYAVRRLLEQTHGKVQQIVIDPEGEYASLRERFDYVLASKDGDTPADPRSAKLLAERLLELKASAILDIYELKARDRIQFVSLFLDTLVNAPKRLWHPALVVIDEAHIFCPQAKSDDESSSAAAVKDMCTRGRKRGFCVVLATQRLSKLHKDAAAECNNKLIGRSAMDVDMKRAAEELGFTSREQMLSLRSLKPGDFYAFGPAISNEVTLVHVGAVTTTHPKAGSHRRFKSPPPTKHIRDLLPKLGDLPAEVDAHELTMNDLRRQVKDLRAELRTAAHKPAPAAPTVQVVRNVISTPQIKRLDRAVLKMSTMASSLESAGSQFKKIAAELSTALHSTRPTATIAPLPAGKYSLPDRPATPATKTGYIDMPAMKLPKGQRKVLIAVSQHEEGVTRQQVSVLSGFRRSTRDQYLQWLVAKGFVIQNSNEKFTATPAGLATLGDDYKELPTGFLLLQHWYERLPKGQRDVLKALVRSHPSAMTRQEISDATNYKRSTRDQYLAQLITRKLAISEGDAFRASDSLFG